MSKQKLGIDMDGVIANWFKSAITYMNNEWFLKLEEKDFYSCRTTEILREHLPHLKDKENSYFYERICPPGFFNSIEPYPGAIDKVISLANRFEIIFVTKPLNYQFSSYEKTKWLKKYFKDIDYRVILVGKSQDKGLLNLDYIIDDDPAVIKEIKSPVVPIMIERRWNEIYREEKPSVISYPSIVNCFNE